MQSHALAYRRDIDGLRAVAVVAVLANHVAPRLLPAGFIGVDIFFVLSGFLISRIVYEAAAKGQFSYLDFYWRRCRRIIPALVVTLVATWILGAALLTGPEFTSLGRHVAAAGVFSSNLLLWREVGYFDTDSAAKPLLHLWSLGVEEQFYLIWPTMLVAITAQRRMARFASVALLGGASLILSTVIATSHSGANFYLLPSRFWELLAGGALAMTVSPFVSHASDGTAPNSMSPIARELLSALGVVLMVVGFVLIDSSRPFPGPWALLPVLATVAFIAAGPDAFVNRRILGNGVAVWFGLISYPLYLWHWPLLSLVRIVGGDLGFSDSRLRLSRILVALLAVLLAYLTFRFVELPVQRYARTIWRPGSPRLRAMGRFLVPLGLIAVIGFATDVSNGFPARYGGTQMETAQLDAASHRAISSHVQHRVACDLPGGRATPTWCYRSSDLPAEVAIFGDSHAEVVFPGLVDMLRPRSTILIAQTGCPPLIVTTTTAGIANAPCVEANQSAMWLLLNSSSIKVVLLVSRGPIYLTGNGFGRLKESRKEGGTGIPEDSESLRVQTFKEALSRTIAALTAAGKQIVLVQDVPELGFRAEDCVVGRPLSLRPPRVPCSVSRTDVDRRNARYHGILRELAERFPSVALFDASRFLCDQERCVAMADGKLLYSDGDHLSLEGSKLLATELGVVVNRMLPDIVEKTDTTGVHLSGSHR